DDTRLTIRRVDGQQSAWGVSGSSGNTIKGTCAIKRDAGEAIETSIPDKRCALVRDVNPPESPAAAGIVAAGRAIKESTADAYRSVKTVNLVGSACGRNADRLYSPRRADGKAAAR